MTARATRDLRAAFRALLVLLGVAVILTTADAAENEAFVGVGEVVTRVGQSDLEVEALTGMLRTSLEQGLRDLDLKHKRATKPVLLSLALQEMSVDAGTRSMTCAVSVALRTARGGAMFATIEGRARVGLASGREARVEARAIDAAVRAALAHIPEALR